MVKFGFKDYETEFYNWSKPYKQVSVHSKRVYEDGEVIESNSETVKLLMEQYPDRVLQRKGFIYNSDINKERKITDYFLVLDNKEYQEQKIESYFVGCTNTEQTHYIRLKFMFEEILVSLETTMTSAGMFASSFYDAIESLNHFIDDVMDDLTDSWSKIRDTGIIRYKGEDKDMDYTIVGLDETKHPIDFSVSTRELQKALIGIELYKFEQRITENLKEL